MTKKTGVMKVYITGIAGFIGYHTAIHLNEQGHEVVGCDNFNDYYDPELKYDRADMLNARGIAVDAMDLCDICSSDIHGMDMVLHLAGYAGVRDSLANPYEYIQNNVVDTQILIDVCTKYDVPIVYASSSSVCAGADMPFKEDSPFHHHSNPYAWSKYVNECQFKSSNLPTAIGLRFFTVYGPWGRPDMALHTFADQITAGRQIELYNYGNMKRDFTYVKDIVKGVYIALKLCYNRSIKLNDIYNIGYGKMENLTTYVEELEKNLGKVAVAKLLVPAHPADALATWSDISKLSALGYKPTTSIVEGIKEFTDWYKEYYNVDNE